MFDELIERCGTNSLKWDGMEERYGVPANDGLAMWVADTDFKTPDVVAEALHKAVDFGIYGYLNDAHKYKQAIAGWMNRRHDWEIDPDHILTTTGIVNAVSLALEAYTKPGDGIVIFTPVYHAFARVIHAMGRKLIECPLRYDDGRYTYDWAGHDAQMDRSAKMAILCSPHNPGGRVWTEEELRAFGDFCKRHDLLLVSDEIHHDITFPGSTHIATEKVCADCIDRMITLTAPSKTFNLGGLHTGNAIIRDDKLRDQYANTLSRLAIGTNSLSMIVTEAVYSGGDAYADALQSYIAENARIFDVGINAIPGLRSMEMEGTYLAWVDFGGTGMAREEFTDRVQKAAKIASNLGPTFGKGGENFLRFNIATPRTRIVEAVERMQNAFADLQ